MIVAIWIIAICEAVRVVEATIQTAMLYKDRSTRENAYAEFVKSLKWSDRQYVKRILREFEEHEDDGK